MGNDFFGDLGETLSKTAKGIGEKADVFFETQKLMNKSAAERRLMEKTLNDLGNLVYRRFVDGEEYDIELAELCEKVTKHQTVLAGYKEEIAQLKGHKICGDCGASIDKDCAFCPKCGTPCPEPEEEPFAEVFEETKEETEKENKDDAQESVEDASSPEAAESGEE